MEWYRVIFYILSIMIVIYVNIRGIMALNRAMKINKLAELGEQAEAALRLKPLIYTGYNRPTITEILKADWEDAPAAVKAPKPVYRSRSILVKQADKVKTALIDESNVTAEVFKEALCNKPELLDADRQSEWMTEQVTPLVAESGSYRLTGKPASLTRRVRLSTGPK